VDGFFASGEPFRVGAGLPLPEPFSTLRDALREFPGSELPGWPRVRKNSSGYALDRFLPSGDASQLLAGSEGTLAFITEVELRAPRLPPAKGLAVVAAGSAYELTAIALEADRIGAETCEFLGARLLAMAGIDRHPEVGALARGAYALALLEVMGSKEEVALKLAAATRIGQDLGRGSLATAEPEAVDQLWHLRHDASPTIAREAGHGRFSVQFIEDSVVPPENLGAYLDGIEVILRDHALDAVIFGHAGDGNVHVNPLVDTSNPDWPSQVRGTLEAVVELVASLGGTLSGEHGDGRLRAPFLREIWAPALVDGFRSVKETLDPRGILNPGVILPLEGQDPLAGLDLRVPRKPA
jgi:FAD/FMN-containing dehydrogenase